MDLSALNDHDRQRMLAIMEERQVCWICAKRCGHAVLILRFSVGWQMKDSLRMYNNLVQRCFMDCISDFTSKSLGSKEVHRRCSSPFSLMDSHFPTCV